MKHLFLLLYFLTCLVASAQTWEAQSNGDHFTLKKINSTSFSLEANFSNGSTCVSTLKRLSSTKMDGGLRKEYYSEEINEMYDGQPWYKVGIVWFAKPVKEGNLIADFGFVVFNDDQDETYDLQLYVFRK